MGDAHILREVERHLRNTGIAPSTLGRSALNDPSLVRDLRNGRIMAAPPAAKLRSWMAAHSFDRRAEDAANGRPSHPFAPNQPGA